MIGVTNDCYDTVRHQQKIMSWIEMLPVIFKPIDLDDRVRFLAIGWHEYQWELLEPNLLDKIKMVPPLPDRPWDLMLSYDEFRPGERELRKMSNEFQDVTEHLRASPEMEVETFHDDYGRRRSPRARRGQEEEFDDEASDRRSADQGDHRSDKSRAGSRSPDPPQRNERRYRCRKRPRNDS